MEFLDPFKRGCLALRRMFVNKLIINKQELVIPRIRCHYIDCVFIDDGYSGVSAIENDPDIGCMTHKSSVDTEVDDHWECELSNYCPIV